MRPRQPVLFIGHGSPVNALADNPFTRSLRALGRRLSRPQAILVVSAHWLTEGTWVTGAERPAQIYDFFGFPDALYRVAYRPVGSPEIARRLTEKVSQRTVSASPVRGLDHAAWAILHHLFPAADIPVVEMSLDITLSEEFHLEVASSLSFLRDENVLVIGSGNIVHNLQLMSPEAEAPVADWAAAADRRIADLLAAADLHSLARFSRGGDANLAVPAADHFLPLLYAAALRRDREPLSFVYEGFQYGTVSMRSLRIG